MRCVWQLPYGALDYLRSKGVDIEVPDGPLVPHTHPVSALLRNWFELCHIRRFRDKRIKSVGGNDVRHARDHSFAHIHSCCPTLDGCDEIRNTKRLYRTRGDYCTRRFQECEIPADVYLFSHSMYYISRADLACIPAGSTIVAIHNVYPGPGSYTFGESTVTELPSGLLEVRTRGNDHPYVHAPVWLKSECCISTGYTTITFTSTGRIDVCHAYTASVRPSSLFDMLIEPVDVPHEPPTTELIEYLVPEFTGVSVTARLIHTGQLRARTFFSTRDLPIPDGVDDQVAVALQRGMAATLQSWGQISLSQVEEVNHVINCLRDAERSCTTWYRMKHLLWSFEPFSNVTSVLAYVLPLSRAQAQTLYQHSKAKLVGGFNKFMRQFGAVKLKQARWFDSKWFPAVPTCIPASTYENELTSIFTRSLPPARPIVLHPSIRESAKNLALKIGKVDRPMDFDLWVSRFRPARQAQLRAARYCPLQYAVEFFQKIEQLDEVKQPRAIQARVDAFKAHIGPWVAAFELQCRDRLPIFIKGLEPWAKAAEIARLGRMSDLALEIDFSRFDRSLSAQLLENTEHVVYSDCLPRYVADALKLQLRNYVKTRNNAAYLVDGTRMSGDVNTSIGNCIVNAIMMTTIGIPLGRLKVEGDDMLAAITTAQKKTINMKILTDAGLKPEYKILPMDQAEFCSRRLVVCDGTARLCRDPRREIRRTGYSIHNETEREKLDRGIHEWAGLPMFGPLYQTAAGVPVTPISVKTRQNFALQWGISEDEQRKFEEDPYFRVEFAQEIASPDAPPTGDRYRPLQGTPKPSDPGNQTVPVCSGVERATPPRCEGKDVRDVSAPRPSESAISSGSRDDSKRGSAHRRRLRRKGRSAVLCGDSRSLPEKHDSRMEGLSAHSTAQPGDETKVVSNVHRHNTHSHRGVPN